MYRSIYLYLTQGKALIQNMMANFHTKRKGILTNPGSYGTDMPMSEWAAPNFRDEFASFYSFAVRKEESPDAQM